MKSCLHCGALATGTSPSRFGDEFTRCAVCQRRAHLATFAHSPAPQAKTPAAKSRVRHRKGVLDALLRMTEYKLRREAGDGADYYSEGWRDIARSRVSMA